MSTEQEYICDIIKPSDWHHHFREGDDWLATTVPLCFSQFEYAIAMPNLNKPVQTYRNAMNYYDDIVKYHSGAKPVMTYYLNTDLGADDLRMAGEDSERHVLGVKYYPKGATTNSGHGITTYKQVRPQLSAMLDAELTLMIHGEDHDSPIFDREMNFAKSGQIRQILEEYQGLRITIEHISSKYMVDYLVDEVGLRKSKYVGATITPHHLKYTTDDIFKNGIKPAMFCCPILKTVEDRLALQELACSGCPNVFLGTDNAPHTDEMKGKCGKPGIFNIHSALNDVAELFVARDNIDRLEGFASIHGCEWYSKAIPSARVKLYKNYRRLPQVTFLNSGGSITPLNPGGLTQFQFV